MDKNEPIILALQNSGRAFERIVRLERFIDDEEKCQCDNILEEHQPCFACYIQKELGDIKNFDVMKKHYKAYVNGFDGAKELRIKLMATKNSEEVEKIKKLANAGWTLSGKTATKNMNPGEWYIYTGDEEDAESGVVAVPNEATA